MATMTIEIPEGKRAEWVDGVLTLVDEQLKDITERIKTFEDACEWCDNNDNENLTLAYKEISDSFKDMANMQDVFAYLKLRIITAALNEGWEPTFEDGEERWTVCQSEHGLDNGFHMGFYAYIIPSCLYFKSNKLAEYAATQFKDIYMDFCHKGKE